MLQQPETGGGNEAMRAYWRKLARVGSSSDTAAPDTTISSGVRVAAIVLRTIFICLLILITLAVSMPQNETIWTVYDTPLDVVRLLLGVAVCVWLVTQLFRLPSDAHAYRTWMYLGLCAIPFALACLGYIWFG
jgi:hypothetical protein